MRIFEEAYGGDPQLMVLAKKYIDEMPKAARKGEETDYRTLCNTCLEAFRAHADNLGLTRMIVAVDKKAQDRFKAGEAAADKRSEQIKQTISNAKTEINENTNTVVEGAADDVKKTVQNEAAKTRNTVKKEAKDIKQHVTAEHDETRKLISEEARGTRDTVRVESERTREVVREEGEQTRASQTANAKLTAKRQTLSDMLNEEITGLQTGGMGLLSNVRTGGIYRDSTIKWLGGAADRIIGDPHLSPEQKEQALDELIRMVDEELIIDDDDKEAFNNTYFPQNGQ